MPTIRKISPTPSIASNNEPVITDEIILQDTMFKLSKLIDEEMAAIKEKESRDETIQRLSRVYEAYAQKSFDEFKQSIYKYHYSDNTLTMSVSKNINNDLLGFDYPDKASWKEKIIAILKFENRVLSVNELIEIIEIYQDNYTRKQLVGLISNTINTNLVKNGILRIYKPPIKTKGFFYGNPSWWDGDVLGEEHKPKPKEKKIW